MFKAVKPATPDAKPFIEYVHERATAVAGSERVGRAMAVRALNHINEFDHLRDSLNGRTPTDAEHAAEWNTSVPSVERVRRGSASSSPA